MLYLTGLAQRELYGQSHRVKTDITIDDLTSRTSHVVTREIQVIQDQLARNHVRLLARGQIAGDSYGMLKLLVSSVDRKLLGVQLFGTGATESVHIGQAVMGCAGTVDYLVDAVFNYPTLAEAYKIAALDVTNKLRAVKNLLV